MKRRVISMILVLVTILTLAPTAFAADFEITNGILTEYTGSGGSITIPKTVTTIGGSALANKKITAVSFETPVAVTSINTKAFKGNDFTSFSLPKTVENLGTGVFMDCTKLKTFTIPSSTKITEIPAKTFEGCGALESITVPEGVTTIGAEAFHGCSSLGEVDLPASVTTIGDDAFNGCDTSKLMIKCYAGSAAAAYASYHGLHCTIKTTKITKLTLSKKIIALKTGGSAKVNVTPTPEYAAEVVSLTPSTDDPGVATVVSSSGFTFTVKALSKTNAKTAFSVAADNNDDDPPVTATIPVLVLKPSGWITLDGATYYCDDDGVAIGWKKISGRWYYFSVKDAKMLTGWQTISGKKYYFTMGGDYKGSMLTGLRTIGGKKYFFNSDGVLSSGFKTIDGRKYYFSVKNNEMLYGLQTIAGKKYFFRESGDFKGSMVTGKKTVGGKTYYFGSDGAAIKGFKKIGKHTYYFSVKTNEMLTGWQIISGKKYYFTMGGDYKGTMLTGMRTVSGKKYYFKGDGTVTYGWFTYKEKKYYASVQDGHLLTGTHVKVGDNYYDFDSNGKMTKKY